VPAPPSPQSRCKADSSPSPSRNTFGSSQELVRACNFAVATEVKDDRLVVRLQAIRLTDVNSLCCCCANLRKTRSLRAPASRRQTFPLRPSSSSRLQDLSQRKRPDGRAPRVLSRSSSRMDHQEMMQNVELYAEGPRYELRRRSFLARWPIAATRPPLGHNAPDAEAARHDQRNFYHTTCSSIYALRCSPRALLSGNDE
jgi:hypothetical protein